jgi:hypothetical protein
MWAGSTWSSYSSLWSRYLDFVALHDLTPEADTNAALFVASLQTSLQTQHQYCKTLQALFNRFGWGTKTLSLMAAGMRHQGALIPMKQATPISRNPQFRVGAIRMRALHQSSGVDRWYQSHRTKGRRGEVLCHP